MSVGFAEEGKEPPPRQAEDPASDQGGGVVDPQGTKKFFFSASRHGEMKNLVYFGRFFKKKKRARMRFSGLYKAIKTFYIALRKTHRNFIFRRDPSKDFIYFAAS